LFLGQHVAQREAFIRRICVHHLGQQAIVQLSLVQQFRVAARVLYFGAKVPAIGERDRFLKILARSLGFTTQGRGLRVSNIPI